MTASLDGAGQRRRCPPQSRWFVRPSPGDGEWRIDACTNGFEPDYGVGRSVVHLHSASLFQKFGEIRAGGTLVAKRGAADRLEFVNGASPHRRR